MDEDNEYLKLPIEDQCVHKLWKARVHGYEAALKLFGQWDEKAPEWNKYTALMKKIVIDSNAVAQEKGLEAVLCFVENSAQAGKTVGDVVSGLVAKCLGAPKARTKDLAVQIALMYVEIEKYEVVQEELLKGITTQKNPKVVAACITTLTQALREFGPKVVNLKLVLKQVPVLLEDRDKNVRDEGKKLVVELYRWIGQALKPQLSALKPIQVSELEAEFEKLGNEKPVQSRFLRSQQDLKAKMQAKASGEAPEEAAEDEVAAAAEIDPYELLEPVDILAQLPKDFYDKCEAKKWQERKEAVDSLEQLTANPKLQPGDYGDLVRALKKIISKDTNVMVVAVAGKCLAGLANGLKKKFSPYALVCISTILEKFKEKKQNVVTAMREAIDAIYPSTTLEAMQEDVIAALDNKNPSVKAETTLFLARCFSKSNPTVLNKKLLKAYCAPLLKTLNESDPAVRDGSAEALGTAMKVVGEKGIMPFLPDLEQIKMAKIKEFCDKAVISGRPAPKPAAAAPAPKEEPVKAAAAPPAAAPVKRPGTVVLKKAAPKAAAGAAGGGKPAVTKKAAAAPKEEEKLERELSPEEAEEKAAAVLPADVMSGLGDSNWKTRLAAMESMTQTLNMLEKADIPAQAIIRTLCKKPGLKDTNFQVLKLKLEAVKLLAEKSEFSKRSGELCIADVTEKLGDAKNSSGAIEALTAVADACGLEFTANNVLDFAMGQKNPKVQAESLVWLSNAIKEFGLVVQPKPLIEVAKKGLAATNPAVRTATITLLGTLYLYMGPPLRSFFEGEKPALLQQIDSEFEKYAGQTPPAPIRGAAVRKQAGSQADNEAPEVEVVNVVDLLPRTDISSQITESLITEMGDKNWKVRNEALQKVIAILNDAKYITPQLGELPSALAARMTDSNANLVQHALNICQTLATSMGPNCKQHVRTLLPGMLQALSVNKPAIRSSAVTCLNAWVEQCNGMKDFFEGEMIADAIKGGNPYLKADLLTWLADRLPNMNPRSLNKEDVSACLPHVYAAIEDRSAEVRKGAQDVILPLMIHLGYETMAKAAGKLKPASKNLVLAQLDKARPNLPAKPAPAAAAPPAPAAAPAPRAQVVSPAERHDEEPAPRAAPAAAASKAKPVAKAKSGAAPAAAAPAASKGGRKKEEDVDTSPLMPLNTMKTQRINDELKLKVLKWNFAVPRDEFVEQLKEQMNNAGVNKTLMHNMFNADFKFHIRAIDSLLEDLPSNAEAQKANLDLILRWMTLRFFDTNPSVLLKGLEYLQNVFTSLSEIRYSLHDTEAASFIPYLILKVGDPKDTVKNGVHAIIKILWRIYPVSKLFPYVMEGIKSKNARQRTECLDELGALIEGYGVSVCQPNPSAALKEVAKQIADRDNAVRNAALNCITVAYMLEGEKVYKLIGQLSDKDLSLLEERIKRSAKNKPAPAAAAAAAARTPAAALQSSPESKVPAPRAGAARPVSAYMPAEAKIPTRAEMEERPAPRSARPISGIFALELEETVQQAAKLQGYAEHDIQIDLVQTNFEQLLNEPIPLIGSKLRAPSRSRAVTGSPAKVNGADEINFDLSISQFTHPSPNVSISAMQHVESVVMKSGNESWLEVRVDQILIACAMQMRLLHSSQDRPVREVLQGCKAVIRLLMAIFGNAKLAQRASRDVLKDVTQYSLQIMIDSRLANEDAENQVVKSLNVLVLKMVEKSDHTAMTSALLKLLHESVAVENSNGKYIELVMKCLWRMVRNMPEWINSLNTSVILMDIHLFLKAYPSSVWKDRQSDTPIRTIKTIIHTLVRLQGDAILADLGSIENARDSELEAYIQKLVKSGVAKDKEARPPLEALESEKKDAATKVRRLSKSTQDTLTAIFRKIGDKEHTKEGLAELYEFKQRYPDADIEPFLRRSSDFFKKYIERGLIAIEQERMREQVSLQSANNNLSPESSAAATAGEPLEPDAYMERLKKLRALAGLDTTQGGPPVESHSVSASTTVVTSKLSMKTSSSVTIAAETETVTTINQSSGAPSEVDLLRRRLEILKNSGKIPQ